MNIINALILLIHVVFVTLLCSCSSLKLCHNSISPPIKTTNQIAPYDASRINPMWNQPSYSLHVSRAAKFDLLETINKKFNPSKILSSLKISSSVGVFTLLSLCLSPAYAQDVRRIGEIPTSGFIFKDSLKLVAIKDPKIPGITIYLSDFDKSIVDKVMTPFDDPSSSSVTCVQTGPALISKENAISEGKEGEEVFDEARNLFFKVESHCTNYIVSLRI